MTEDKYQTIRHPLKPYYNNDSQVLILGSFPSVKTREYGFFYGHLQNRFWPLLEQIFSVNLGRQIQERKNFLKDQKLALYDCIYQCDIIGSKDSSIKNVIPTNLKEIVENSQIKHVFCNGATSYKYYKKYHEKIIGIKAIKLPSTSPANARYSFDKLMLEWMAIKECLK
ncbi:MAG: DNA-deoxyinosine glycosylase [Peptoniphilaceae bacterium]|nr:DNA-deoxyinosine glycosylase [Peptoniphilaceae bacterium]MDY6018037.1 DNA-deoxyinosine glycosylase [Anaerococcus sp.]